MSAKLIEALGALGIGDTENITRVVIDLKMGVVPVVYVEHVKGGALLDVINSLDGGPRIEWVTAPDQPTFAAGRAPVPDPVDVKPDPWLRA